MATGEANGLIHGLRRAASRAHAGTQADAELLEHFVRQRDEAAFAELVRRHGPMVLAVGRRILGHTQDAEDAAQATFLVLVRKAASIHPRRLVGHWLYGVAFRTAMKARTMKRRRRQHEQKITPCVRGDGCAAWAEIEPILDEELNAMPEKYRLPIFLCDVEGKTHRQAADLLGCPVGTVSTRLVAGRRLLAQRLRRRGVTLPAGGLALLCASHARGASLPTGLAANIARAGTLLASGSVPLSEVASAKVVTLTRGVLNMLLLQKLKRVTILGVGLLLLATATTLVARGVVASEDRPAAAAQEKAPISTDAAGHRRVLEGLVWYARTLDLDSQTISLVDRPRGPYGHGLRFTGDLPGILAPCGLRLENLRVAKGALISLDGKPATLQDVEKLVNIPPDPGPVRDGVRLTIKFAKDGFTLARLECFSKKLDSEPRFFLADINPAKGNIAVRVGKGKNATLAKLPVAKDADVELYYYAKPPGLNVNQAQTSRKAALQDLQKDMSAHVELAPDAANQKLEIRVLKAGSLKQPQMPNP